MRDRTAAELGDLRVAGTGEWIPTLDEMLALVGGPRAAGPRAEARSRRAMRASPFAVAERLQALCRAGGADVVRAGAHRRSEGRRSQPPARPGRHGRWRTGPHHLREALDLGVDFISYAIDDLPTPMPILARGCSASR